MTVDNSDHTPLCREKGRQIMTPRQAINDLRKVQASVFMLESHPQESRHNLLPFLFGFRLYILLQFLMVTVNRFEVLQKNYVIYLD